ncbi:MAG: hypothetical protein ACE5ID_07435, partial [Acidobacteriota bacterium]
PDREQEPVRYHGIPERVRIEALHRVEHRLGGRDHRGVFRLGGDRDRTRQWAERVMAYDR